MAEQVREENKMGTAPVFGLIIKMSLPAMFAMLVSALYNIVDSYFVAKISDDALAAVSLAFPIQNLIVAFAVGTSAGVGSLISRKLGEKKYDDANSAATHGVIFSLLTSLVFAVLSLIFAKRFFMFYTNEQSIIEMGTVYLNICSGFCFGSFLEICNERILQSTGNMIWPMITQFSGAIINIILDPIMIFGYFGFPEMGIAGAAVATVIGQIAAMVLSFVVLLAGKHEVRISFKGFKFSSRTTKEIYRVGIPSIVMQSIGTVMNLSMNAILAGFSKAAYTVFGLYYKLQSFIFMPVFGLSQGLMPIIGYNFGAKNKSRLMSALRYGCLIAGVIMTCGLVVFMSVPDKLLMIFIDTQEILDIGIPALRIICLNFIPAAIGITFSTLYQAVGKGIYSMINSVMRQLVVLIPAAWLLSKIGLQMVWWAFPIAEVASLAVTIFLFIRLYNTQIKNLGKMQSA